MWINKQELAKLLSTGEHLVHDSFEESYYDFGERITDYYDVYVVKYKNVYYYIKTENDCCVDCKELK